MLTPFETGQKVIYTSEARKRVGLSREIEAVIEKIHYVVRDRLPVYSISWPPTGYAMVNECEICAVPEQAEMELQNG